MIYRGDYRDDHDPKDPYLSPLFGDFSGLPPMLIQVGEIEMLRSDGECAAQKVQQCGGRATAQCYAECFMYFRWDCHKYRNRQRRGRKYKSF